MLNLRLNLQWILALSLLLASTINAKHVAGPVQDTPLEGDPTTPDLSPGDFNSSYVIESNETAEAFPCDGGQCQRRCCPSGQLFDTSKFACENASSFGLPLDLVDENDTIVGVEAMRQMWTKGKTEKNMTCGYFTEFDLNVLDAFRGEVKKLTYERELACANKMRRKCSKRPI